MAATKKSVSSSAILMLGSELLSSGCFNDGLPSFVTWGVDAEQIWQQCELRNNHKMGLTACTKDAVKVQIRKPMSEKRTPLTENLKVETEESNDNYSGEEEDNTLDAIKKRLDGEDSDGFGSEDDDDDEDPGVDFNFQLENEILKGTSGSGKSQEAEKYKKTVTKWTTIVDDKFFKLADMEDFLESEEAREVKRRKSEEKDKKGEESDVSEDDGENIDMFADDDSDSGEHFTQAKYADFFDPPEDNETKVSKGKGTKSGKRDCEEKEFQSANKDIDEDESFSTEDDDEDNGNFGVEVEENSQKEEDYYYDNRDKQMEERKTTAASKRAVVFDKDLLISDDENDPQDDKTAGKEEKSTFEQRQEELQQRAREMEDLSLKEASWELSGEASASKRPENSLLETVLDFQHTAKTAPVITDDTTETLEDYIKQRIRDKTFDDVERKEKPKEEALGFKKRIVLDQEKSKLSLGELYEQEFLKQQKQEDEEVKKDPECEMIERELNKLFKQLDALSNFRYTPTKAGSEVKIVVNTPAIAMEEVAPVATADSQLLAPEEVHEKKQGNLKADDERDSTDKKRALRQKKKEKREKRMARESRQKLVEKTKPGLGNKYSKTKALKELERLSKTDRNITMVKGEKHQKLASSTAFFSQLQDEVQMNVKAHKGSREPKKKRVMDASKVML